MIEESGPNRGYYERWENNIKFEESAQANERGPSVDVKAHSLLPHDSSVTFVRTFAKQPEATSFMKIIRNLSRVRCVAQKTQSAQSGECPIYQGNITEVKPEPRNNPVQCYVTVEFSQDGYRDIEGYLEHTRPSWKIEEDKLAFYQQMRENLEKLSGNPEDEEIFIRKAEPQRTQSMNQNTQRLYMTYVGNDRELNEDQKQAVKEVKIFLRSYYKNFCSV